MKAYFSVMGIGLGHMARSVAIAKELRAEGIECVFSTYGDAARISEDEGFKTYKSDPMMWYEDEKGHLDYRKTVLKGFWLFKGMTHHFSDERKRIDEEEPDIIISDSRYTVIPASKISSAKRIYITNQPRIYLPHPDNAHGVRDPNCILERIGNWWNYNLLSGQDAILIPDFPKPHSISYRHMFFDGAPSDFEDKIQMVGPIAPHRPDGLTEQGVEEVCKKYGVEPGNFIYIAFSGPGTIKKEIKKAIYDLFDGFSTPAIMGTGKPGEFSVHERGNLRLIDGWIEERETLMDASKLVVSRGGLSTLSEIVAFGKKAVVIPQPNQPEQQSNAEGMERLGMAIEIDPTDIDRKTLKLAIEELLDSDEASKKAEKYRKMSREWIGEKRAAELIKGYI